MNRRELTRPLTRKEQEEIINNIDLDADEESNDDEAQDLLTEVVSESEDDLEIESGEESDVEPQADAEECSGPIYTAKSGLQWNKVPIVTTRRRQKNIVNARPGITDYSKDSNTVLDIFNLFLTTEMKDIICRYTNEEAVRYFDNWNTKNPNNRKIWSVLEIDELDSFLGVLIKAGALRCRKESTREMWSTNTSIRRSFFTAALPRDRFEQISIFLRFDDKETRAERKEQDKLAAISDIWNMFVDNCRNAFEPYEQITIDEQLVCFRGKCPFRQYIKSKPGRYGIKIWAAADVRTSYLCNLQVYTGKPRGGVPEKNQGFRVVSDLVQPYHESWRGITTDNFFTSVPLANYLLTKKLTLLGTVRKNKPDTPPQLKLTSRPIESSVFAFTKNLTMVSYIPKKNRMVHLLSSQHDDDRVCPDNKNKPYIILDYNASKGGVDNVDKLIREYSCTRRTARWPYRLFMNMIDIGASNAFILYIEKNPDWKKNNFSRRRLFLLQLGDDLARSHMEKRSRYQNQRSHVKSALRDCGMIVEDQHIPQPVAPARKRARCYMCPRRCDKKVNTTCAHCRKFVCEDHRRNEQTIVCTTCLSN